MLRGSVFLKLLAIFVVTGAAVNAVVFASFRGAFLQDPMRRLVQRHIGNYLAYVVDEFGNPPAPQKVARFTRDFGVDVRIEDQASRPLYGEGLPETRELESHLLRYGPWQRPVGNYQGRFFLIYATPDLDYVFFMPKEIGPDIGEKAIALVIGGLTVIFAAAYFVVRRTLTAEFRARVAESVAAKEQLLRDVSHELRSPQTRMRVALELVPEGHARQAIADDLKEMERMTELILESARFDGTERRPSLELDLSDMARELAATFRDAPPGIDLEQLPRGLKTKGDPEWMRIAIRNVLDNALKYSRDSGRKVEVSGAAATDEIQLRIVDHGPGIPEAELKRVFEPFHRVDRSRQKATGGFGLGLHLTKKALEAQGARIELASAPGRGTTAVLRFPRAS